MNIIYRSYVMYCLTACIAAVSLFGEDVPRTRNLIFNLQGNFYHGSIVGRNHVDGISGATKNGHGTTVGVEYNLKGHPLQAEVTFGWTKQSIHYGPPTEAVAGERDIKLYLLNIPVMYSFHFFPKQRFGRDFPRLILSAGAFGSFTLLQEIVDSTLESPDVSSWALGPFLRAAYYPWPFKWLQPGIFLEFYRSFVPNVYDDRLFNDDGIAGQLGIMNMGISLRL
ncbi:MAG: hypothetical protein JW913_01625 [Chitinispirillaceae bacterium]|nr:hypothetical protein [Chitinispirillaceae bacterium]